VRQSSLNRTNLIVLGVVATAGGVAMWREGYLGRVNIPFALYGVVALGTAAWFAAFEASTKRFLLLALVAGAGGLATQLFGATVEGLWVYPPPHHSYWFVPATFVFAGVLTYGLTRAVAGPWLRARLGTLPRVWNVLVVSALAVTVIVGAELAPGDRSLAFRCYYVALIAFALFAAAAMDIGTLIALVASAIVVGGVSETLGARSSLWTFRDGNGWLPPAWLILGSWPLETILHYSLSGLLAGESLLARPKFAVEERIYEPMPDHPMWAGGAPRTVVIRTGEDRFAVLDEVLEKTRFLETVERRRAETGRSREELRIAVKPNFMFLYSPEDRSTFTDPALVEHLVTRLIEAGYREIAVVEAQSCYGNFFHDREVENVARVAGYEPRGRYRIADLTEEAEPHRFSGTLGDHLVGRTWRDADFRISFAKNKTHTWAWYTLTLKNIYGALPMQNKLREYHYRREIYSPTIDLLVDFPVHFGLIDAWESADGPFGIFADKEPNETRTILGGESLVALDWLGAEKMGLDPMVSRYMQLAVQAFGRPEVEADGDTSRYEPWENVPKHLVDLWDHAEECYGFTNTTFSILNRDYVSRDFRRKPMSRLVLLLTRLLRPLGGAVYRRPAAIRARDGRLGAGHVGHSRQQREDRDQRAG